MGKVTGFWIKREQNKKMEVKKSNANINISLKKFHIRCELNKFCNEKISYLYFIPTERKKNNTKAKFMS